MQTGCRHGCGALTAVWHQPLLPTSTALRKKQGRQFAPTKTCRGRASRLQQRSLCSRRGGLSTKKTCSRNCSDFTQEPEEIQEAVKVNAVEGTKKRKERSEKSVSHTPKKKKKREERGSTIFVIAQHTKLLKFHNHKKHTKQILKTKNIGLFPESNRGHLYPKQVFYH